jgi:hypothetical protein
MSSNLYGDLSIKIANRMRGILIYGPFKRSITSDTDYNCCSISSLRCLSILCMCYLRIFSLYLFRFNFSSIYILIIPATEF